MVNVKEKPPKPKGIVNKHLHSRTTFLFQASTYLTLQAGLESRIHSGSASTANKSHQNQADPCAHSGLALQLGSDLQTVSRKGQVRLSAGLKRSVCKTCNAVLIPGCTAVHTLENESRGGKKPWADVLVSKCTICGSKGRFPVGAKRQKRKAERDAEHADDPSTSSPQKGPSDSLSHELVADQKMLNAD